MSDYQRCSLSRKFVGLSICSFYRSVGVGKSVMGRFRGAAVASRQLANRGLEIRATSPTSNARKQSGAVRYT